MLVLTPSESSATASATEWLWVRSADGLKVDSHGVAAASALPADTDGVLLVPPSRLSWHRVACPKAPASRLRAVLDGLLEDRLLDDTGQLHLALEPGGRAGQTLWVAACDAAWLRTTLATLLAAGRPVARIAPALWPTPAAAQRAFESAGQTWLSATGPQGVVVVPVDEHSAPASVADLLKAVAADEHSDTPESLAEPACAATAERLLGRAPEIASAPELMLRSVQGPWDLAQFEFSQSAQARRGLWLRDTARALLHAPAWRPARWGLVGLLLVQLVALNAQAWQSRQRLIATQAQTRQLLTQTFPQTTLVLDAPLQMRRALADLRQNAGEASSRDLESLLQTLAQSAPDFNQLSFGPSEAVLRGFRPSRGGEAWQAELQQAGWSVQLAGEPPVLTLKARP